MRDYKDRVIDRRRVREVPPWFWLVAASAGGALIAMVVYLASLPRDGNLGKSGTIDTLPSSLSNEPIANEAENAAKTTDAKASRGQSNKITATPSPTTTQPRFAFYETLPGMVVATPPDPEPVAPKKPAATSNGHAPATEKRDAATPSNNVAAAPAALPAGPRYVLLAGYFRNAREAEQLRARIAALGFSATVQTVKSAGKEPRYRVRLGPYAQKQADEVRNRLRASGINAVPLKSNG